jgi:hypothetical protein
MDDHDKVHSLGIFFYVLYKWLDLIGVIKEEKDVILEMEPDKECWIEIEG